MRFISQKAHGMLDFATAGAMIVLPRMMDFSKSTTNLMTGTGAVILGMSLLTRYPMGVVRVLPMQMHLAADGVLNAVLLREANNLSKKEEQARNAIMGMAISGLAVSLLTRTRESPVKDFN